MGPSRCPLNTFNWQRGAEINLWENTKNVCSVASSNSRPLINEIAPWATEQLPPVIQRGCVYTPVTYHLKKQNHCGKMIFHNLYLLLCMVEDHVHVNIHVHVSFHIYGQWSLKSLIDFNSVSFLKLELELKSIIPQFCLKVVLLRVSKISFLKIPGILRKISKN